MFENYENLILAISIISDSGFQTDLFKIISAKIIDRVAHSVIVVPIIRTRVYVDRISRGFVEDPVRDNGPSEVHARVRAVSLPIT